MKGEPRAPQTEQEKRAVRAALAALPVLSTEELGTVLECSPTQVRRMDLPGFELGHGRWRYVTALVLAELAERSKRGGLNIRRTA